MSKTDNLHDFLKDLADTIREKTGVSESLNPQDFSKQIKNIQGSGSSEEESVTEYYYEVLPDISDDATYLMVSVIPSPDYIFTNLDNPKLPPVIESSTLALQFGGGVNSDIEPLKYFRFKDAETYTYIYNSSSPEGFIIPANTGDLESRTLYYLRHHICIEEEEIIQMPEERVQELMNAVSTSFKKITKEEYWQALKDLNS